MLKIKDKLGKLLAVLKDNDDVPQPAKHGCCETCNCCCECDKKEKQVSEKK